ncbi:MAG: hypothetical protein ACK5XJ_00600 [Burkholderiales bacterium]|jgi:hypothetical protein
MSDLIKTLAVLAWVSVLTAAFIAAVLVLTPIIPIEILMGVFVTVGVTPLMVSQG